MTDQSLTPSHSLVLLLVDQMELEAASGKLGMKEGEPPTQRTCPCLLLVLKTGWNCEKFVLTFLLGWT